MATTETRTTSRVVGTSVPRKEDHKLVTGHGQFIDNINLPGQLWLSVVRSPYAHAHDQASRADGGARAGGRRRRVQRRRARGRLGGLAAVRLAGDRRDQDAVALPAGVRQGTARRRRRGSGRRRLAGDREGRRGARRGRVRAARCGHRRRACARCRRSARPRRPRDERVLRLEARRRRGRAGVRRRRGDGQGQLSPAAADPGRDGAARRARARDAGDGRADVVDLHADPAHRAAHACRRDRGSRSAVAGDRARRRRRLRLEARRLRRGGALPRARTPAQEAGQVDRGALGGHSTRRSTAATSSRRSSSQRPRKGRSPPSACGSSPRWAPTCSS